MPNVIDLSAKTPEAVVKGRRIYTNILIPTDGSELPGKAVQHGIALAKRIGARGHCADGLAAFSYVHDGRAND